MSNVHLQFGFFDPKQEYSVTQGVLPHWEQPGATYFITYRTHDSIPQAAFELWQRQRADALRRLEIDPDDPNWTSAFGHLNWGVRRQFARQFATILEASLDELHGAFALRYPNVSNVVAENLLHFDGMRYSLGGFVVMPNHVHVLVCLDRNVTLKEQCRNWKHYQSCQINSLLGNKGRLWQPESFDHLVRDGDHFQKFRKYIQNNPVKSRLKESEFRLYLPNLQNAHFVTD